jgi:hypothetical protein
VATTKYQYGAPGAVVVSKKFVGLPPVIFTSSRYHVLKADTNRKSTFVDCARFGVAVKACVTVAPASVTANVPCAVHVAPPSRL